jgi:ribosomal protein L11 methylase PrmA
VRAVKPRTLWDLGCNTGEYSLAATQAGAGYVIGFDYDIGALDEAFRRSAEVKAPFLPLFFDAANPSPSQGWRQRERSGLHDRADSDALLALAFEHHLTIGRNVPIPDFLDWLLSLAPRGLIEFVEKTDPTVQKMLAMREDIFENYTLEHFGRALEARTRVLKRERLANSSRWLFWYEL